jgi:hypothetical protein
MLNALAQDSVLKVLHIMVYFTIWRLKQTYILHKDAVCIQPRTWPCIFHWNAHAVRGDLAVCKNHTIRWLDKGHRKDDCPAFLPSTFPIPNRANGSSLHNNYIFTTSKSYVYQWRLPVTFICMSFSTASSEFGTNINTCPPRNTTGNHAPHVR